MFHPVGPQPPSVYWRRRLVVLSAVAAVLILLVLTVKIAATGGGQPAAGSTLRTQLNTSHPRTTPAAETTTHPTGPTSTSRSTATTTATSPRSSSSNSATPQPCAPSALAVQAVAAKSSYHVGDSPVLELQVTDIGAGPCVQDLADKQIELRVYNGESRVRGSHDCQIEPGTNLRTLNVDHPVRVAITWSGLSSQPGCAGTRQRVGAGTYTLYALLAGKTGKAAQFTIS
jgi:hypothetical protein